MPVQIDEVHTEMSVRPPAGAAPPAPSAPPGLNGTDRAMLERLRPLVLQILNEELDRLRRQHG